MTAAEFLAAQAADPDLEAQRRARDEELLRRQTELRRAERPLVDDLARAGLDVSSVWDLVNTSQPYPDAIPILASHLERDEYPDRVREGIARALAVRDARSVWDVLLRCYREAPVGSDAKQGLAAALAAAVTDETISEVVALARDPDHGESRILLVEALALSRATEAVDALEELKQDPVIGAEATRWLRK